MLRNQSIFVVEIFEVGGVGVKAYNYFEMAPLVTLHMVVWLHPFGGGFSTQV